MSNRVDLFTTIHKGLRWWMWDVNAKLGALDAGDPVQVSDVLADLVEYLDTLDAHSMHEERFIAPVLDARAADRAVGWHGDHATLDERVRALRVQAQGLRTAGSDHERSGGMALELYRSFARFSSMTLVHLDEEETVLMPVLWALCSDDELDGIMSAFRAEHGEESVILFTKVARAFSPREREILGV